MIITPKEQKLIERIRKANPVSLRKVTRTIQRISENCGNEDHWEYLEGAEILETALEISEKR